MKRIDLYNKSRVMGDYQARFCEQLGGRLPGLTRPAGPLWGINKDEHRIIEITGRLYE
jgi:hypothetical protein